jgi:hypothetical protein
MNLEDLNVEELVKEFVEIALEQDQANLVDDVSKYNHLFRRMHKVERELKQRPGDQRRALVPLCHHSSIRVRLNAAMAVLPLAPEQARQTLQAVKELKDYPASAEAYGMLRALEQGTYVPD